MPSPNQINYIAPMGQGEAVHDSLLKAEAALWTWKQVETGGELWAVGDFFYGTCTRNGESITVGNIFYIFGGPLGQSKFGSHDSWLHMCHDIPWSSYLVYFPQFLHPLHALKPSDHRPIVSDSV